MARAGGPPTPCSAAHREVMDGPPAQAMTDRSSVRTPCGNSRTIPNAAARSTSPCAPVGLPDATPASEYPPPFKPHRIKIDFAIVMAEPLSPGQSHRAPTSHSTQSDPCVLRASPSFIGIGMFFCNPATNHASRIDKPVMHQKRKAFPFHVSRRVDPDQRCRAAARLAFQADAQGQSPYDQAANNQNLDWPSHQPPMRRRAASDRRCRRHHGQCGGSRGNRPARHRTLQALHLSDQTTGHHRHDRRWRFPMPRPVIGR